MIFIPEYHSYIDTCVKHTANDTFVSMNLKSLAFNYAANTGNMDLSSGIAEYNLRLNNYCSSQISDTSSSYAQMLSRLYAANDSLTVSLFSKLIEPPIMF